MFNAYFLWHTIVTLLCYSVFDMYEYRFMFSAFKHLLVLSVWKSSPWNICCIWKLSFLTQTCSTIANELVPFRHDINQADSAHWGVLNGLTHSCGHEYKTQTNCAARYWLILVYSLGLCVWSHIQTGSMKMRILPIPSGVAVAPPNNLPVDYHLVGGVIYHFAGRCPLPSPSHLSCFNWVYLCSLGYLLSKLRPVPASACRMASSQGDSLLCFVLWSHGSRAEQNRSARPSLVACSSSGQWRQMFKCPW